MFERFTDRARRVLVLAQEEASLLNHSFIGTEHILLGLVREGEGVAAQTLQSLGISLEAVRWEVNETIGPTGPPTWGSPPFTPRAKIVLALSLTESRRLGHDYIGTEHILLGLLNEGGGVGAQVLVNLGADLSRIRDQAMQILSDRSKSGGALSSLPDAPPVLLFTAAASQALSAARILAGTGSLGTQHLLLALFDQEGSLAAKVLNRTGIERGTVRGLVDTIGVADTTDEPPKAGGTTVEA